jgi:hypothetical protein
MLYWLKERYEMSTFTWFDDLPVVGALPPKEAAARLREIGEDEVADVLEAMREEPSQVLGPGTRKHWWSLPDKLWFHTGHAFGYLAPAPPGRDPLPIRSIGTIHADTALKQARVKITLDRLRVADYPGRGTHRVLLHFSAQNQVPSKTENLHFSATYRIREGEHAAIRGYPIFVGLTVASEGVHFKCATINVKNDQDEAFLDFLESDVFTSGLHLATVMQPALAPLSALTLGLTKTIAERHRNLPVQEFDLGLDFGNNPMGARLAEGAYLAVQIPESLLPVWDWDEWVYHPASGQVVMKANHQQTIPYNYLVFGVSRYEGD